MLGGLALVVATLAAHCTPADVVRVAEIAGRAGAAIVRSRLGAEVVQTKASRGDLLTAVDGEVQALIEAHVRDAFPTHAFLGEESVAAGAKASAEALRAAMDASEAEWLWICDPIDGSAPKHRARIAARVAIRGAATRAWCAVRITVCGSHEFRAVAAARGHLDGHCAARQRRCVAARGGLHCRPIPRRGTRTRCALPQQPRPAAPILQSLSDGAPTAPRPCCSASPPSRGAAASWMASV
jgi:hypothetical protein